MDLLKELMSGIDFDFSAINMDSVICQTIGTSSIYLLMMALAIQDRFGVEITPDLITPTTTIRELIDYIEKNTSEA